MTEKTGKGTTKIAKAGGSGTSTTPIRVRMAPSPTGFLHIGTARTALSNFLFARRNGGMFMLRIEDTDAERSKTDFEIELIKGLHWLGLEWDEGPDYVNGNLISKGSFSPYRQSERQDIYKKYVEQLLAEEKAYYCYCTKEELDAQQQAMLASGLPPKYSGHCRPAPNKDMAAIAHGRESRVVRFKTPEMKVEFKDIIRGKVEFDASLLGDMIITRSDGSVLYNLAVVIDDGLMGITHVIRGEDHISNTPKQILFQKALGFPQPTYAHLPLILNQDRSKFSKRKNKASLLEYQNEGYLPEAFVNFMALLGWHPKDDREVLGIDDLVKEFELERVQKAGAVFDLEKLNWLNREHMKKYSDAELATMVQPFIEKKFANGLFVDEPAAAAAKDPVFIERLVAIERTRANTLSDFAELGSFFFKVPDYEPKLLIWKESPKQEILEILKEIHAALEKIPAASFTRETLSAAISFIIEGDTASADKPSGARTRGTVLWPLRVALSGLGSSPDPLDIMTVLGKDESLARVAAAIKKLPV
jgi:nondiscriminating glutamyl-tRNA synthetase